MTGREFLKITCSKPLVKVDYPSYYTDPAVKQFLLGFVHGRRCQIHYGVYPNGEKKTSKFFFLHDGNYDRVMTRIHPKYGSPPIAVHVTPSRYILYPVRMEGEYALDLVLDFDGRSYEENFIAAQMTKNYFIGQHLTSWMMWRTRGSHDGIQLKVPFECFLDKVDITPNDLIKIKQFYLKLVWFLNNTFCDHDLIELKAYKTTFRVPNTYNEKTQLHCTVLYDGGATEYLSGVELINVIEGIYTDPFYHKLMRKEIILPRISRTRVQKKVRVKYGSVNQQDFPPCFKTGMFTKAKEHVNHEMIIFAAWCFLKGLKWSDDAIVDYLKQWQRACKVKEDMDHAIAEKHKGRALGKVSCEYIINQAKFCPVRCGKSNPLDGLK